MKSLTTDGRKRVGHERPPHGGRAARWDRATGLAAPLLVLFLSLEPVTVRSQQPPAAAGPDVQPLALKEEMVKDRFERFEDRVYRLRELLSETEPENAGRLENVLERAGELGLAEQLEELTRKLRDPSALNQAYESQGQWLGDAERLLAILLERGGDDEQQKKEMERLQQFQERVARLLDQERGLRAATGRSGSSARMLEQLEQAIKRLDAMQRQQAAVAQAAATAAKAGQPAPQQLSGEQNSLSRDAQQLAEDLERLSQLKPEDEADTPAQEAAREKTGEASKSTATASKSMSQAGSQMQGGDSSSAQQPQQQAAESLQKAREQLEAAKQELEKGEDPQKLAEEQKDIAKQTGELGEQMQNESSQGQGGKSGQPGKSTPGQPSVQNAQKQMDKAAESLDQAKRDDAAEKEDRAIEELEQAQKELEEALSQMRKEEREETLRDLESRFREMLTKQKVINDGTNQLAAIAETEFRRAERLQLADLSSKERALSQDAAACVHILDEDGTTVVVPRVLTQLSEDMRTVANRLAATDVGTITQAIEKEIVETLEQLLESVQRMQQESEQQGQMAESESGQSPLLPPSAELKLLRAGQLRVNTRTVAIEEARAAGRDSDGDLNTALKAVATRQAECASIAEELRSRLHQP